jgi:hypothetical protein
MTDQSLVLAAFCALAAWPLAVVVLFVARCFSALVEGDA